MEKDNETMIQWVEKYLKFYHRGQHMVVSNSQSFI